MKEERLLPYRKPGQLLDPDGECRLLFAEMRENPPSCFLSDTEPGLKDFRDLAASSTGKK